MTRASSLNPSAKGTYSKTPLVTIRSKEASAKGRLRTFPWMKLTLCFPRSPSATAFLPLTMEDPERSMAVMLTGTSSARSKAKVSSPVPQPASSIFAPGNTGTG